MTVTVSTKIRGTEAQRHSLEQWAVDVCSVNEGRHVRAAEHVDDICTDPRSEQDKLMQALRSETQLDVCANMCNTAESGQVAGTLPGKDSTIGMPSTLTLESFNPRWHVCAWNGAKQRWETSCGPCDLQCVGWVGGGCRVGGRGWLVLGLLVWCGMEGGGKGVVFVMCGAVS